MLLSESDIPALSLTLLYLHASELGHILLLVYTSLSLLFLDACFDKAGVDGGCMALDTVDQCPSQDTHMVKNDANSLLQLLLLIIGLLRFISTFLNHGFNTNNVILILYICRIDGFIDHRYFVVGEYVGDTVFMQATDRLLSLRHLHQDAMVLFDLVHVAPFI